jgi:hypothetical protein
VNNVNKWTDTSLLKEIIKDKLDNKEITEDSFSLFNSKLKENGLDYLKQWRSLTEEEKDKDGYPRGLRNILDNVSGKNNKIIKKE